MADKKEQRVGCECEGGMIRRYSRQYDKLYCLVCRAWYRDVCEDEDCGFCIDRPREAPVTRGEGD